MAQQQKLIIHGGAGSLEGNIEREEAIRQSLQSICEKTYAFLLRSSANEAVIYGIKLLEDDPLFIDLNNLNYQYRRLLPITHVLFVHQLEQCLQDYPNPVMF